MSRIDVSHPLICRVSPGDGSGRLGLARAARGWRLCSTGCYPPPAQLRMIGPAPLQTAAMNALELSVCDDVVISTAAPPTSVSGLACART